jgi:tetratricopeptide (TPR) repeat protein
VVTTAEGPSIAGSDYRYWAFISYSSKDKAWGRWLHRAIETYGIPAQLVSHPTPAGHPAPRRFHPLFRDRDELPASADLGAQIEEALRASRYLIVVCSRHAAQSRWVNKEIETFQKFDRHGRILAIIVDGEPNAGDERECFPPALRQFEPIAADARPQGDGKTNAKLRLLAGMLGVSFDALKQRDAHRQIRRLQLAVSAALLVVISLAGMAWYSNHQRIKAVKARQQAESILEYLLYDLRDKLQPVGRLDIVHDVQKRVDEYYRQLGTEKSDANTLRNRGTAFNNEGDRLLAQGDLAGALSAYREYQTIMQRLTAADPSNAGWQRDLSVSHDRIGDVLLAQGDLGGALQAYRATFTILERLAAADPSNAGWQFDLGISHERIGSVLQAQGDLSAALTAFERKREIISRLAAADPSNAGWQRDLSVSHNKIGDVLLAQGDLGGALQAYRAALAVRERLAAADASNAGWQRDVVVSCWRMADTAEKRGDGDAQRWWSRAYEILSAMQQRGIMLPTDEPYLETLRRKAGR